MKFFPKSDDCFKELFRNETVRLHFISDVLQIHISEIKSIRLANTFLWKAHKRQKQGILDIFLELNNNTKINIEIQLKRFKNWKKRQLFYLAQMFTSDLTSGDNYSRLNHCISIALIDFNLIDGEKYHNIYHLRDADGNLFSNTFEIHIIELNKELYGNNPLNDWIRFFNAESEDDLSMIKTQNPGIRQAIKELRRFSLAHNLRLLYEAHLKDKRDRIAMEEYQKDEALYDGIHSFILDNLKEHRSKESIIEKIQKYYAVTKEEALEYYDHFIFN